MITSHYFLITIQYDSKIKLLPNVSISYYPLYIYKIQNNCIKPIFIDLIPPSIFYCTLNHYISTAILLFLDINRNWLNLASRHDKIHRRIDHTIVLGLVMCDVYIAVMKNKIIYPYELIAVEKIQGAIYGNNKPNLRNA